MNNQPPKPYGYKNIYSPGSEKLTNIKIGFPGIPQHQITSDASAMLDCFPSKVTVAAQLWKSTSLLLELEPHQKKTHTRTSQHSPFKRP